MTVWLSITLTLGSTVSGIVATWFFARHYYNKALKAQEEGAGEDRKRLIKALEQANATDSEIVRQQHIAQAVAAWIPHGTPRYYLDSIDVSREEKAIIYRAASLRHKRREPRANPYVDNE